MILILLIIRKVVTKTFYNQVAILVTIFLIMSKIKIINQTISLGGEYDR